MLDLAYASVIAFEERGLDPNIVRPGWTALFVVAALGVALFFLSRSFIRHQRKAREPWPGDEPEA